MSTIAELKAQVESVRGGVDHHPVKSNLKHHVIKQKPAGSPKSAPKPPEKGGGTKLGGKFKAR